MFKRLSAKREDEGFTLIELLVVIVILGILAAVVVFAVGGITDKGDAAATDTDKRTLQTAQEAHYAKQTGSATYTTEAQLKAGGLLASESSKWDVCIRTSDKKAYEIVAQGADCATAGFTKTGVTP